MSRYPEHAGMSVAPKVEFDIVEFAESYFTDPTALAIYLVDNHLTTEAEAIEFFRHFEDSYVGWYEDGLYSFAEEYVEHLVDSGLVSEEVRHYIDLSSIIRDLEAEGYRSEIGHVFRPA